MLDMILEFLAGLFSFLFFLVSPAIIVILGHWLYPYLGFKAYGISFLVYLVIFYACYHDMPCLGGDRSKRRK